tara:strand:+ start:276 stop:536 length:261 start_codon:yes stop_codon:yes gene_type:complete
MDDHSSSTNIISDPVTPAFIESMVDRVIEHIVDKLEELDISLDYIAAALIGTDALSLGVTQTVKGRAGHSVSASPAPIAEAAGKKH